MHGEQVDGYRSIGLDEISTRNDAILLAVFAKCTYRGILAQSLLEYLMSILELAHLLDSGNLVMGDTNIGDFLQQLGFDMRVT